MTVSETNTFTKELNPAPSAVSREQGTSVCVIPDIWEKCLVLSVLLMHILLLGLRWRVDFVGS